MRSSFSSFRRHLVCGVTRGSFMAASGPFARRFFLPTRVGIGGSYFFFLSLSSFFSLPPLCADWFCPCNERHKQIARPQIFNVRNFTNHSNLFARPEFESQVFTYVFFGLLQYSENLQLRNWQIKLAAKQRRKMWAWLDGQADDIQRGNNWLEICCFSILDAANNSYNNANTNKCNLLIHRICAKQCFFSESLLRKRTTVYCQKKKKKNKKRKAKKQFGKCGEGGAFGCRVAKKLIKLKTYFKWIKMLHYNDLKCQIGKFKWNLLQHYKDLRCHINKIHQ